MIAFAAVAMAVAASAATTHWQFSTTAALKDGYNKDGGSTYVPVAMSGATLYLLAVADSGYTTQAALLNALNGGTTTIAAIKSSAVASVTH